MIRVHKVKLNPTPDQRRYFAKCAADAHGTWNWALSRYMQARERGEKIDWNSFKKEFRASDCQARQWSRETASCVVDEAFSGLSQAISTYFKSRKTYLSKGNTVAAGRLKFPGFRSRKHAKTGGFVYTNIAFRVSGHSLHMNRLTTDVNMCEPLHFQGKMMSARFTRSGDDWVVSISVETEQAERVRPDWRQLPSGKQKSVQRAERPCPRQEGEVGLHFGLRVFLTTSTGESIEPPRFLRQAERRLSQLQRGLSKKVKGSRNSRKQLKKLQAAHRRVANCRSDFQHKITTRLVRDHAVLAYDKWGVQQLIDLPDQFYPEGFYDAGVATSANMLKYKGELYGTRIVIAEHPASKKCSTCGAIKEDLKLADLSWQCDDCGSVHDRERNAVLNNLAAIQLKPLAGTNQVGVTPVDSDPLLTGPIS